MKTLNTFGVLISIVLFFLSIYYIYEVSANRYTDFLNKNPLYAYSNPTSNSKAVFAVYLPSLFFVFLYVFNLIKIKTITTKVLTIIGLSLNFIVLTWGVVVFIVSGINFDEAGGLWIFFALVCLAFSIVFIVQTNKVSKIKLMNDDILDDMEFN